MELGSIRSLLNEEVHFQECDVVDMAMQILHQMEKRGENNSHVLLFSPGNIMVKEEEGKKYFWYEDVPDTQMILKEQALYSPVSAKARNDGNSAFSNNSEMNGKEDSQADVSGALYSLGMVMYQLLNDNKLPFIKDGMSFQQRQIQLQRRFSEVLPVPAHGSVLLSNIIIKACNYDVAKRFHRIGDFLNELLALNLLQDDKRKSVENETADNASEGYFLNVNQLARSKQAIKEGSFLHRRYRIGQVIGSGGFGITYQAWDEKMAALVAVKEYFPKNLVTRVKDKMEISVITYSDATEYQKGLRRFINEAKSLAQFSSNSVVVNVFDYFEENHTAYIVMEYLDGQSLKSVLEEEQVLSVERGVEMMKTLAMALYEVHEKGIVHCDINPDNIFICKGEKIRILDFGAAKSITVKGKKTQTVILTPQYAPLEQFQQVRQIDARMDIYSLGATMYKAFTGVTPPSAIDRIGEDKLISPGKICEGFPEWLETVLLNCMELSAENRYSNMKELAETLEKFSTEKESDHKTNVKAGKIKKYGVLCLLIGVCMMMLGGIWVKNSQKIGNVIEIKKIAEVMNDKQTEWLALPEKELQYLETLKQQKEAAMQESKTTEESKETDEPITTEQKTEKTVTKEKSSIDEEYIVPDSDIINVN